jgi:hypothetical protein
MTWIINFKAKNKTELQFRQNHRKAMLELIADTPQSDHV